MSIFAEFNIINFSHIKLTEPCWAKGYRAGISNFLESKVKNMFVVSETSSFLIRLNLSADQILSFKYISIFPQFASKYFGSNKYHQAFLPSHTPPPSKNMLKFTHSLN